MTLATGVATTSTGTSVRTSPAAAVITARPGASAMTTPSADTSATRDAELRQVIVSSRSSLAADHEVAESRTRCPMARRETDGVTLMLAAGPGTMRICSRSR